MCLPERNTDSRGRPPALRRSWKRRRGLRRACRAWFALMLLLLAFLAPDLLALELHALALVGLGRTPGADLGADLTHQPLVDALDLDQGRLLADDPDPGRDRVDHVVREPEIHHQVA